MNRKTDSPIIWSWYPKRKIRLGQNCASCLPRLFLEIRPLGDNQKWKRRREGYTFDECHANMNWSDPTFWIDCCYFENNTWTVVDSGSKAKYSKHRMNVNSAPCWKGLFPLQAFCQSQTAFCCDAVFDRYDQGRPRSTLMCSDVLIFMLCSDVGTDWYRPLKTAHL